MLSYPFSRKKSLYTRITGNTFIGLCVCFSTLLQASETTPPYDERLLPVAQTFLKLQLCSSYATEHEQDISKGDRYSQTAWTLYDRVVSQGWDKQMFSSAMVVAHEQRSLLEVREDDTPESFKSRHQSGEPCDDAEAKAQTYLAEGLPTPQ